MKKGLVFQSFRKQHIHTDLYWYYANDYINKYALLVRSSAFGDTFPISIEVTCLENGNTPQLINITKAEFMVEYKKALKLLQNVNIVTR
jgi:hypothetical protein